MDKITYMATVIAGFEPVLVDEICHNIANIENCTTSRGKVFFQTKAPRAELLGLRTADNLYRLIHTFPVGFTRADLPLLEEAVAACDLSFVDSFSPFIVNASRRGEHTFSRFEAADAAMRGMERRYLGLARGTAEEHAHEFRLDLHEETAVFSYRLTDASFRFRGLRSFAPAALRPTVAHALVRLSSPAAADRFIDPCCGSGTIMIERLHYAADSIRGGDLSLEAVRAANTNWPHGMPCPVRQWDARQLPCDPSSIDVIVSNLPFGRQIGSPHELRKLYHQLLAEMSRILRPGGRAVLLAEDGALLQSAAERYQLRCSRTIRISLKGIQPAVYMLTRA